MARCASGRGADAAQWLAADRDRRERGNGTLRLTTRQAFQLHGVLKWDLRQTIHGVNEALLDTIAACGDVNRNVMRNPNPYQSGARRSRRLGEAIGEHLLPHTRAYHEIWMDGETGAGGEEQDEPIYGRTYLPRKFKIAIALPPYNDMDVFTHDLGFIAIVEDGRLVGFNVMVGGGMGMTHGEQDTFPAPATSSASARRSRRWTWPRRS